MIGLILAAGLGTRLRPLTLRIPKPLLIFGGKPLIGHWIDYAEKIGCREIFVNVSYLGNLISDYVKENYKRVKIIDEARPLGTAQTILNLAGVAEQDDMFIAHCDNLSVFNPSMFYETFKSRPSGTIGTMMVFRTEDSRSCGMVNIEAGVMTSYIEKPKTYSGTLANAAVFIFESKAIMNFKNDFGDAEDFCRDILPYLIGRVNCFYNGTYHRDIGTPDGLKRALIEWDLLGDKKSK